MPAFRFLLLVAAAASLSAPAHARPVSYLHGLSVMLDNRARTSDGQTEGMATYTLLPSLALGAHAGVFRYDARERVFALPTAQWLARRWAADSAQANLYLGGGYGLERAAGRSRGAGLLTAEADWETRELYASGRAEALGLGTGEPLTWARGRVGFAPYLAEMEGLHTWILFQVDRREWLGRTSVSPMLRFFYRNVLFELGASLEGEWLLNWSFEL